MAAVPSSQDDTVTRRREPLPVSIYVLAGGTFLMGTTEFVVAGLLPEMAGSFHRSQAQTGLAITVFAVGMIIGSPTMPLLTLRLPHRTTLVLALATFAVAHLVLALTTDFTVFLLARFVAAMATGTFWAVASTLATRIAGRSRSSGAMGVVIGGGMLATVLGVPLGAVLGQSLGWRGPFWILLVLAALEALVVIRLVPAQRGETSRASLRREVVALRSAPLWLALATCAAVNAGVLSVYSYVSPLLTQRSGLSASAVPLALALFGVGALVGNVVGGRIGDTRPLVTPVVTAVVSLAASALIVVTSTSPAPTVVAFALLGLVGLSANPVLTSMIARFGGSDVTLPNAMAPAMFNLGTAVGTAVTSAAIDTSMGALAPAVVGTAFGAVVFLPLGLLVVSQRRSTAAGLGGDGRDEALGTRGRYRAPA